MSALAPGVQLSPEARVLPLIELISRAATEPDTWQEFVELLSAELDDVAVTLTLDHPNIASPVSYRVHAREEYVPVLARYATTGELPWSLEDISRKSFAFLPLVVPDRELTETGFYRDYMAPQEIAPCAPLVHGFGSHEGELLAVLSIFSFVGARSITSADQAWLDLLVPYLSQAYEVHARLMAHVHREDAYQEVLDRFPIGVILIDSAGRALASNHAARRIAGLGDGFDLVKGRPTATVPESDAMLRASLDERLTSERSVEVGFDQGFALERPSGLRPFSVLVARMLASPAIGMYQDAVAVIYISDPEFRQLEMRSLLGSFHQLTAAEIDLAALICEGATLESAAQARGVSLHTARSQLKRIFAKTGTKRQADLVGLVAGGLTKLRTHAKPGGGRT